VGGTATNVDGPVTVKGLASGAVLVARKGVLAVRRAENCLLSGTRVEVGQAVNCEILGDAVEIGEAEGCTVAGRQIHIGVSRPGRHNEMRVLVLVPDLSSHDAAISALAEQRAGHAAAIDRLEHQTEAMAEARRGAELVERVRNKEITLNPQQAVQFRRMVEQLVPQMKSLAALDEEVRSLRAALEAAESALVATTEARRAAGEGISCALDEVDGDTTVRRFPVAADAVLLAELAPKELRARLRGMGSGGARIFSGASGSVAWRFTPPELPSDAR
jgi:chorismate mutase